MGHLKWYPIRGTFVSYPTIVLALLELTEFSITILQLDI